MKEDNADKFALGMAMIISACLVILMAVFVCVAVYKHPKLLLLPPAGLGAYWLCWTIGDKSSKLDK